MNDPMLDKLIRLIERRYGDLSNDSGCNISTDRGYRWLSVAEIVELIRQVDDGEY